MKKRVKAQEILKVPTEQIEYQKIGQDDEEAAAMQSPSTTRLEHDYLSSNLGYGDRLRVVDDSGNLYDIVMMPNGQVQVQDITLKIEYGKISLYNSWEDADEVIPEGYSIQKAIVANKKRLNAFLDKVFTLPPKNPYKK